MVTRYYVWCLVNVSGDTPPCAGVSPVHGSRHGEDGAGPAGAPQAAVRGTGTSNATLLVFLLYIYYLNCYTTWVLPCCPITLLPWYLTELLHCCPGTLLNYYIAAILLDTQLHYTLLVIHK